MQPGVPDPRGGGAPPPSPVVARTIRAILDAAVATLSRDPRASLGDIARAAGVGRTTLHRHFPDRATLVRALARDADEETGAAIARSRIDEGAAAAALARVLYELIVLGDRFTFLLKEPDLVDDPEAREAGARASATIGALIARGQRAGELRGDLDPAWISGAAEMLVYGAWMAIESGALQRADAHSVVVTTLLDGITA